MLEHRSSFVRLLVAGSAALLGPMGSCCSEPIWCKPQWECFISYIANSYHYW
jgi:hypothetical protein